MQTANAGKVEFCYENGFLRYISAEGSEIVRMIYFALRDENWGTMPIRIEKENIQKGKDSFSAQYEATNFSGGNDIFRWTCTIKGEPSGKITFEIAGEALTAFKKNRAGFCVLHPIKECVGQNVEIHHPDSTTSQGIFPVDIAVDNPFKKIKAMRWAVEGKSYSLNFEGDVFETEDQRNWSDASFKTFCTPLEKPFPVLLNKGEKVWQRITFTPDSPVTKTIRREKIHISISPVKISIPKIGIHDSPSAGLPGEKIIQLIKRFKFSHYRVDVNVYEADWRTTLKTAAARAASYELPLELAVHVSENFQEEIESLVAHCVAEKYPLKQMSLFSTAGLTTPQEIIDFAAPIRSRIPDVKIGGGTDFNFTELNRYRFNPTGLDFITYSVDPQEHASDDQTLIENVATQYDAVMSAKAIYPQCDIHVSPVALKRRFNPYATVIENRVINDEQRTDHRQSTDFCPLWTLGSVKYLAESGAASVTYFQTIGPLGIVSEKGIPFPVTQAFELTSVISAIYKCYSSEPLKVDAICDSNRTVILWNYTYETQIVRIEGDTRDINIAPRQISVAQM